MKILFAALVLPFSVFLLISPSLVSYLSIAAGEKNSVTCADVVFGTAQFSDNTSIVPSSFTTSGFGDVALSVDDSVNSYGSSSSGVNAARIGSGSNSGTLTFGFSASIVVTKVKVLAYQYSSSTASLVVTSSAFVSGSEQSIANASAPDISDSSTDAGYVFTGLDGGNLAASDSLTITSTKRFNLCKIVFTLRGYSSSSSSASIGGSDSSSSESGPLRQFRISPVVSSASSVNAYAITYSNGGYEAAVDKTLTKGVYYIDPEEVALYYQAFKELPANYYHYADDSSPKNSDKAAAYALYGTSARLWTTYTRSGGYTAYFPSLNTRSYIEADIDVDGTYARSSSWNRGVGRLVVIPNGVSAYGSDSWVVKTVDHYAHFNEFANYVGGWGESFDGETTSSYPPIGRSWSPLPTISYVVV